MTKISDEALLAESLSRPSLFAELVRRYEGPFLRRARSVVKNREDAEDVVQETFTKIYLYAPSFTYAPGAGFRSWSYAILLNTARTSYRKRQRETGTVVSLPHDVLDGAFGEAREAPYDSVRERVAELLTRLPKELARVMRRAFLDGASYADIAAAEGVSISAIKTRVYRAKRLLRAGLSDPL